MFIRHYTVWDYLSEETSWSHREAALSCRRSLVQVDLTHGRVQHSTFICWELCDYPTSSDAHSHGSWVKNKNLYPLRNRIMPNEVTFWEPQGHRPAATWFLSLNGYLVGNYRILLNTVISLSYTQRLSTRVQWKYGGALIGKGARIGHSCISAVIHFAVGHRA